VDRKKPPADPLPSGKKKARQKKHQMVKRKPTFRRSGNGTSQKVDFGKWSERTKAGHWGVKKHCKTNERGGRKVPTESRKKPDGNRRKWHLQR